MIKLVIDIAVIFAATARNESGHVASLSFLRALHPRVKAGDAKVYEPPFFGLEFFTVFNRQHARFDRTAYPEIIDDPIPIEEVEFTWKDVHDLQLIHRLRIPEANPQHVKVKGGDLAYLGTAWRQQCPLVTLDEGLLEYDGTLCQVVRPGVFEAKYLGG